MKRIKRLLLVLLTSSSLQVFAQTSDAVFKKIYDLVEQTNFFKANEYYNLQKNNLNKIHQDVVEALLHNAFNQLERSNEKVGKLVQAKNNLPDSLMLKLYRIKEDNAVKLYDYKEAKNTLVTVLQDYKQLLTNDNKSELENNLKIWTALENEAKQQVAIKEHTCLKMEKDKAGLNNLTVSSGENKAEFIFDTGANLSTASETTAKKMGMKIIPAAIEVGTITGEIVSAQLAVCPILKLGAIEIRNSIFLVMKDEALAFPQIGYQIQGILGFPVIEAFKEVQITQDGFFIVPKEETELETKSNLAMDGLTPLVLLNDKHFTLDTGADSTILYSSYFSENRQNIIANYAETDISFGGAGGVKEFKGYKIDFNIAINEKNITLKNVSLLTTGIDEMKNGVYGNIGQDLIRQFDKMTLNFNQMFIKFD